MSASSKKFQLPSDRSTETINQTPKTRQTFAKDRVKKYYFTTGRQINEKNLQDMENDIRNPFRIPPEPDTIQEAKEICKKVKRIEETDSRFGYHTQKSRINCRWKMERLYVPDDVRLPGKSITEDIDPDYFTTISGRPIKVTKRIRDYLKDIRNCFLTRLKTGFRLDEVLLMDETHLNERRKMAAVQENFLTCLKSYETFLKEDHVSSLGLLKTAKEETEKSKNKMAVIDKLKKELQVVQAEVLVVEERWRTSKMFQRFLYMVSPSDWRQIHDPDFGRKDLDSDSSDPCLFNRFREFPGDVKVDLNVKISDFKQDVKESQPPALYFTDPVQIENILSDLERKNLIALAQCKDLDFPAENMNAEVEKAKIRFEQDQAGLEEEIKFVMSLVQAEEDKSTKNEQKLKETAFGLFRDLITDEEYLTMTSYIEDAYEDAVGLNDSNLDMVTMMKEIELKYESLLIALDCLPNDIMTRTTKQFYKEQKRDLEEAREAEKKVRQMETLSKRLKKSLEPPKKGSKERKIMPRSTPPEEQMHRYQLPKILTKEEKERLFLFGNGSESGKLYKPLCVQ